MITHHVLIDFENIQPTADDLSFLTDAGVKITVFANSKQNFPAYMDELSQQFGDQVEHLSMPGSGKNARDFLIAYYIGFVLCDNPKNKISVLTNDKDLDVLIRYLTSTYLGPIERLGSEDITELRERFAPPKGFSAPSATPGKVRQRVIRICAALHKLPANNHWPYNSILAFTDFIKSVLNDCDLPEPHIVGLINFMVHKELITKYDNDDERFVYRSYYISKAAKGFFITKAPANNSQVKPEIASSIGDLVRKICDGLKRYGTSKPRTLKTFESTIKHLCNGELSDPQRDEVLAFMKNKKIIAVSEGTKVTYDLGKAEFTK